MNRVWNQILYISYDRGFISIHCCEIIRAMIADGIEVELIIPSNARGNFALPQACTVRRLHADARAPLLADILYTLKVVFLISKRAISGRPRCIYARQAYMGCVPAIAARLFRLTYVAEVNGTVSERGMTGRLKRLAERLSLAASTHVITPSQTLRSLLLSRYHGSGRTLFSVPNGVNPELFCPHKGEHVTPHENQPGGKAFIVGFVGSMGTWQGIDILKEAILADESDGRGQEIHYELVGDYVRDADVQAAQGGGSQTAGSLHEFIESHRLANRVTYRGYVDYESTAIHMRACDLLLAPYSRRYLQHGGGSPMKLYAYLASGVATIISDLGEFTEADELRRHEAAYLIPPDDSRALRRAIDVLRNDTAKRNRIARNGREWVTNNRTWSHTWKAIRAAVEMGARE